MSAFLDDDVQCVEMVLQRQLLFLDPASGLARFHRPAQRGDQIVPVDRLVDEVAGPAAQRAHDQVVLTVRGDHQGGRVRTARPDLGQQREAVHPWHLDVGDDRVVVPHGNPVERRSRRVGRLHGHAAHPQPQGLGQRLEQGRVVVDDEDAALGHGPPLPGSAPSSRSSPCKIRSSSSAQHSRATCRSFTRRFSTCARIARYNAATK